MATHTREIRRLRWAGTVRDVAALGEAIRDAIRDVDDIFHFSISTEMPGYKDEIDSRQEFIDGAPELELRRIDRLIIYASTRLKATTEATVTLRMQRGDPGIAVNIQGLNRRWTDGTRAHLVEEIDRGARRPYGSGRIATIWAALALVAEVVVLTTWQGEPLWLTGTAGAVFVFAILAAAAQAGFLGAILPHLELIPEGGSTRSARWSSWARRAVGALVLLAVGALLQVLIQRVFE